MNSGSWRTIRRCADRRIPHLVLVRIELGCPLQTKQGKLLMRETGNALGHADGRKRTGLLAIGHGLFLIWAAGHGIRHRPHVHYLRHR